METLDFEAVFTTGRRFGGARHSCTVALHEIGRVGLPSGAIVACDPFLIHTRLRLDIPRVARMQVIG